MRLVMNQDHYVYSIKKMVRAGEEFDAPDHEARIWKMMGRARDAPARLTNTDTSGPDVPPPPVKRGPGRPRKYPIEQSPTYSRRDMRAEDE